MYASITRKGIVNYFIYAAESYINSDSTDEVDWKMAFMLRFQKQQHWDSKKQKTPAKPLESTSTTVQ